jgi:NTP pyrophosphatase (non-canonical NTP hydrolase)
MLLAKELGDVLWYVSTLATELGLDLDEIAAGNLAKLAARKQSGKLHGSGDLR